MARQLLQKYIQGCKCIHNKPSSWPAVKPNDGTGPAVKPNNGTGLQEFSIALEQARNAITGMHYMNDLSKANVLRQL